MNINIKSPIISLNVYDVKSPKEKERKVDGRHFHSLSYRKHGTIELTVSKKTFISKPGCITFIPKRQGYFTEVIEDTNMIVIHFDALDEDIANEPFIIKEVALKSGYGSVSYFVQAFRKSTTYSPTKYREKFLTQEK